MSKSELDFITAHEARALLDAGEISSVELTRAALERIEAHDGAIHSFLTVTPELALEAAAASDRRRGAGETLGPLDGIPMNLKDLMLTRGVRTTAGSRMLENFVPPYDGTVVSKLLAAGAVSLGKTNQDEFAMGSSTENSAFGPTHNPWDTTTVPGGSSGGTAAAVAAGFGSYGLGTDTGGSIRQPASLCGITGVKPTYGRVSRYGVVAFASSLDQIGPLTLDVEDAATVLGVIAGHDPLDATSQPVAVPDYTAGFTRDLKGLKVGVPREYWLEGLDDEVARTVQAALDGLRELGAELREVSLPYSKYALDAYYIIAPAEASANLSRYDGVKYGFRATAGGAGDRAADVTSRTRGQGFGSEVKRRIMLGTYALSAGYYDAYYKKAQQVRTLVAQDFQNVFEGVDVIAGPTAPSVAFHLGDKMDDPLQMYLNDVYTIPANLAGICGVSVPCGFSGGLPIGLQLLGRAFDESTILRTGFAYQQSTDWHKKHPNIGTA